MFIELLFFISIQFIFSIIYLTVGMIGFIRSRNILAETLASPDHDHQSINNFLRYMARRNIVFRQTTVRNTWILLFGVVLLAIGLLQTPDLFVHIQMIIINSGETLTLINMYLMIFMIIFFSPILGLFIGGNIAGLLISIYVDANAIEFFHLSTLPKHDFIRARLLVTLNAVLPFIILTETTGLIATITGQVIPALIVLLMLVVALLCIWAIVGHKLRRRLLSLQPIEQTSWAHLQPRIAAWSHMIGVELREVLIQPDTLGTNINIVGRKRPTLIIGDWILQYSDWRQRDAIICLELALSRKKILNWIFWNRICILVDTCLLILVIMILLASGAPFNSSILILSLIMLIFLLSITFIFRSFHKKFHAIYLDADCIACYCTGDPIAIMVALSSMTTLNGVQSTQKSNIIPSINARLQHIDQLSRQSWPRAPYASEPVPAIAPVTFGSYQLSTTFDQQSEPAPVPDTPYVPLA